MVPTLVDLVVDLVCEKKDFYRLAAHIDFLPEYVVMKIFMRLYTSSRLDPPLVKALLRSKYEVIAAAMKKLNFDIISGHNAPHMYACRS